jgi:transcription elongation GreA/GreB family factor
VRLSKSTSLSTAAGLAAAKDEKDDIEGEGKDFSRKQKGVPADKRRRQQSRKAFNTWAELQDESYEQKRVPKWVQDYEGKAQKVGAQSNSNLAAALAVEQGPKAEGAKLRKWA